MTRMIRKPAMWTLAIALLVVLTSGASCALAQEAAPTESPPTPSPAGNDAQPPAPAAEASDVTVDSAAKKVADAPTDPSTAVESSDETAEDDVEVPFASQPYTVLVSVAFDARGLVDDAERQQVVRDIQRSLARMYGRLWTATCEQNDWLVPADRRHLERLELSDVIDRYPEKNFQKAFLVTIEASGTALQVACREYDSRIRELTPVRSETTRDVRAVHTLAARLMRDAFRPNLLFVRKFDSDDGLNMMEMQVQGGDIIPPDPSATQVVPGDVLRPFVRQMDRRDPHQLKHLQGLPLTYLRVLSIDTEETRGLALAAYISHIQFSLFGGKGRRTQHLAVRQRPSAATSRVRLVLKSRPDKPLISHRLALAYQLNWKSEEDGPQTQLVSDRNGEVVIESRADHPTFWIRVYSGTSLLARVPYAPGLVPFDTIELSDDSVRLGVEGEIQLLADELIDAIALREVLIARARKGAEAGNEPQVTSLLERYETVPGKTYFLEQASNIRINASKEAQARRLSDRAIVKICKGFSDTVETFFTDEKRAQRQEEIQTIRAAVQQRAEAAATN